MAPGFFSKFDASVYFGFLVMQFTWLFHTLHELRWMVSKGVKSLYFDSYAWLTWVHWPGFADTSGNVDVVLPPGDLPGLTGQYV